MSQSTMARQDESEIPDLFLLTFSGRKNEYGAEVVHPLPLSFDRVE